MPTLLRNPRSDGIYRDDFFFSVFPKKKKTCTERERQDMYEFFFAIST